MTITQKGALFAVVLTLLWPAAALHAQDLRLAAPAEMAESGFLKHILPRFKFKHRILVAPVAPGAPADMALAATAQGRPVMTDSGGTEYRLSITTTDPVAKQKADTFAAWLTSTPGRAAIEGFPRGGPPVYLTDLPEEAAVAAPEITGDVALGARLALEHCGRCHVIDKRNRMGGIGSTPSFAAMRGRPHWVELFGKYWSVNPHPSFTEVIGVTEPFGPDNVTHIHPVRITLQDIDAILAFVATLTPKDLGGPISQN